MKFSSSQNQILGALFAGAFGDAFGFRFENYPELNIDPDDKQSLLKISDDTQLSLATCQSLIETKGLVVPDNIAKHMGQWYQGGRLRGLGSSTAKALRELTAGGHWALVGRKGERAAGNGAAMRAAPLAFVLDFSDPRQRKLFWDLCRITHHNEEAYCGALAVVLSIQSVLQHGQWNWSDLIAKLPDSGTRDRLRVFSDFSDDDSLLDIARKYRCSGYVVESVPFALLAARAMNVRGFETVLFELARAGGDVDTNASIASPIYGVQATLTGFSDIDFNRIIEWSMIDATFRRFADLAQ
jgi:ADP-ribosylglycohydrolase